MGTKEAMDAKRNQVKALKADGKSNKEIATTLNMSQGNVYYLLGLRKPSKKTRKTRKAKAKRTVKKDAIDAMVAKLRAKAAKLEEMAGNLLKFGR